MESELSNTERINIALPEKTKEHLQKLAGGERKVSFVVNELVERRYNLLKDKPDISKFIDVFEDALIDLAHYRKISPKVLATEIYPHVEEIKKILRRELPEIQQQMDKIARERKELDRKDVAETTRKQEELEKKQAKKK
jgi:hypothetical protein